MFRFFLGLVHSEKGVIKMTKKAVIEISLVNESAENANKTIEKEIFDDLFKDLPKIPWMKQVEKVEVLEV